MPFDAAYFTTKLPSQCQEVPGHPVVRMILHDAREFLIRDVKEAATGYVMLEIYAPQGHARGGFEFPPAVSLIETPTVPTAIAYEAIAQVQLQAAAPEAAGRLGFRPPRSQGEKTS
ncbi:MAG TPA: hypothetical protein VEI47_04545 [Gemmatimonadales bacterium]|jgi:hypothetical protein|nr:hypothetical protein [Gemmatimonadales bacterium]